jgi:quercetin dioxygenase-like cupin family protein
MLYGWGGEELKSIILKAGMSFHIPTGLRHQMIAGENGAKIIEFSTHHEDSDSIRLEKGD